MTALWPTLEWSYETPTAAGVYWYRYGTGERDFVIVEIHGPFDGDFNLFTPGVQDAEKLSEVGDGRLWAGPIIPPPRLAIRYSTPETPA